MSAVPKLQLGNTGLTIPKICFGTSSLANTPDACMFGVSELQAKATLRNIFEGPINFLDTSRNYGKGRSEQLIGEVLREIGGLPKNFVISTKLDRDMQTDRFDAGRARRSLEESLECLGLDQVQILHLHDPEYAASLTEVTARNGAVAELFKMKAEGLTQAVGLAAGNVDIMMPILREWDFDCLITHNRYTLLNRNAEAMIALARSRGIAVLNAAPYNSGILAKGADAYPRYTYQTPTDSILDSARQIESICRRHTVPVGAAALQFSLREARIDATICGVTKPERIAQTLKWASWPISDDVWRELDSVTYSTEDPELHREYRPG